MLFVHRIEQWFAVGICIPPRRSIFATTDPISVYAIEHSSFFILLIKIEEWFDIVLRIGIHRPEKGAAPTCMEPWSPKPQSSHREPRNVSFLLLWWSTSMKFVYTLINFHFIYTVNHIQYGLTRLTSGLGFNSHHLIDRGFESLRISKTSVLGISPQENPWRYYSVVGLGPNMPVV